MKKHEEFLENCGGIRPDILTEEELAKEKENGEEKSEKVDTVENNSEEKVEYNQDTELVFIIDKSGSMQGYELDTVGGFNSMIEKQKTGEGRVYVSTVLFDNTSKVLHDRVEISRIKPMEASDYRVGGCTALLDAIGGAIHHIGNVHKYARREDVPKNTVFVITTDGMENASKCYGIDHVRSLIKRQTEKYGWEFIFVAANIDAIETAGSMGIQRERAANYSQDSDGYTACYSAMSEFVSMKRKCVKRDVGDEWKRDLN